MPKKVIDIHAKITIRANRFQMSRRQLADFLGCSPSPVQRYMKASGICVSKSVQNGFRKAALRRRTILTVDEDIFLRNEYLNIPVKKIAKIIGRSHTCVQTRMKQLNLIVPKETREKRKASNRFKVGHRPQNKGKRQTDFMSAEGIAKTKRTRFKKGNSPHNETFDGCIRVRRDTKTRRKYKYIRLERGKWMLLQRHIWQNYNGPIPPGRVIIFIDGDPMNCELKNLKCITTSENGRRVAGMVHDRPPELKTAIRLKNKIIKTIKQNEQHQQ